MDNPITEVEEWLCMGCEPDDTPAEALAALLEHAKQSDAHAKLVYQVAGWMYQDACRAMEAGLDLTYRKLSVDQVFKRVAEQFELPIPLDLEVPKPPADPPRIVLPGSKETH